MTPDNPFRVGLEAERTPLPCVFVIFGASGDLTRRKLIPALYNLAVSRLLPPAFAILGVASSEMSDEQFRETMHEAVARFSRRKPIDEAVWGDFANRLYYVPGKFENLASFEHLRDKLDEIDRTNATRGNRLYYLAIPPSSFAVVTENLAKAGLVTDSNDATKYTRIIVEKPFGRDLASSDALNAELHRIFSERQIFRIDHYLGKETVQNLIALRFGNAIFEPTWNRNHVDHVQITVAEDIGVEGRSKFYEESGAMRDIVQNHLLQLLMVTAMEPPVAFTADEVRDEKVKVLRALKPIRGEAADKLTVRGQYGPGSFAGRPVPGNREEKDVSPTSNVETFVAMRMEIDNWRFLRFVAKVPGPTMTLRPVTMDFRYGSAFGGSGPEAYERLILDGMLGDPTLFARADEVSASWRFVTPILEAWASRPPSDFPNYAAGTWGPQAAFDLIERDGRTWRRL